MVMRWLYVYHRMQNEPNCVVNCLHLYRGRQGKAETQECADC